MDDSLAIAVVGMAGRFPGAASVSELWKMLSSGGNALSIPSDAELLSYGVPEEWLSKPNYVRARMRFEGIDLFDAAFFGYSAKHAQMLDPQQRLFLECAWEALETAGYDPTTYDGSIGVFASTGANVYLLNRAQLARQDVGSWRTSDWADMVVDGEKDHIATRVSFKLGLTGPSVGVQTACSSSLVAVHMACQSLLRGECDLALAGGVSLSFCQNLRGHFYVKDGINSPDGYCRVFDANAAGTVWGSGLGIVILKRYEEALTDRDHVCAVIEGTAINNDGASKMGYTAPSVQGQRQAIATAQAVAGVSPRDIDMIEAHGTGTSLGDSIELAALIDVFSADRAANRGRTCALGSLKSNIGHLDTAAGVAGLIKAILCLQNRALVPSLNFFKPNPALQSNDCPFFVNTQYRPWTTRAGRPRRVGISALGFGGTNAHAILREAPEIQRSAINETGAHIFPLSARNAAALGNLRKRLADHVRSRDDIDLGDVAFTLQVGRRRLRHRQVIIAEDREQLLAALERPAVPSGDEHIADLGDRELFLAFSGNVRTMGPVAALLHASDAEFRSDVDECSRACRTLVDVDVGAVVCNRGEYETSAGAASFVAQAACFTIEYCIGKLWLRLGAVPTAVLGLGVVGRSTAECIAGKLTLEDAFRAIANVSSPSAADGFAVYRMSAAGPDGTWEQLLRNTHCMLLQPESENGWDEMVAEKFTTDRRPLVLSGFGANDRDPHRSLLGTFARMWLHGARIEWRSFHAGKQRSRVPLPTYPFERVSYWLPIPQAQSASSEHTMAQDAAGGSEREFFVPSWQVCALPMQAAASVPAKGECWLILSDGALGEQLAGRLEAAGCLPVVVLPGSSFANTGERRYTVTPESAADYSRLLREMQQLNLNPQKIVHCWTLAGAAVVASSIEQFRQRQTPGYFSLLYLAKALAAQTRTSGRSLIVATRVTYRIAGSDECDLSNATLPGLCKVMAQELPSLSCKVLDLGARDDAPTGGHQSHDTDVERVIAEGVPGDPVVAYRGELRFLQTLQPHRFAESHPDVGELRQRGVYVILGGTGKLGLAIAKHLASTCRARLILVTRRALSFRDSSALADAHPDTQALAATLKEIELLGAEIDVVCADVRSEAQLEGAFAHAESRFGRVDGVFHLAADMRHPSVSRPLIELSPQDVEAQMGPKVAGLYALAEVLRSRAPDFVVLFSSNSSILGGIGFGAYAAANSFLDIWASTRSLDARTRWICTNWDRWVTNESHTTASSNVDRYTIGIEEGINALWRIVSRSRVPQVIVAVDVQERLERWVLRRRSPQQSEVSDHPSATRVPPRSELERTIAKIWQEALGCGEIGVQDTFFDLGGDSLIGLGILERVKEIFNVDLPLELLIGSKVTVASLVPPLVAELQNAQRDQSVA